jgi:uncharacterized Tic20 family protein
MNGFGLILTLIAFLSLISFSFLAIRLRLGPNVITLSSRPPAHMEDRQIKLLLLQQLKISFWLVIASGVVALLILVGVFSLIFFDNNHDAIGKIAGIVCGFGDSALFAYFYKVWRNAGEAIGLKTDKK